MAQPILPLPYIFDLEISGRCNTACSFCPREEMLRGEEFMSEEVFEDFLLRLKNYAPLLQNRQVLLIKERARAAVESGERSPCRVIMCGMGESLMHRKCTEWIRRIRTEVGVRVTVVSNGLLLKQKNIEQLADSGVTVILVSVPGVDRESYSRIMQLDWDRIINNIEAAHKVLPGRVQITCAIPDDATFTPQDVLTFWERKGIPVAGITTCHSRGGFLKIGSITGKVPVPAGNFCGIIARHNFVSWDGRILSCCHDLHAENVLGHVSDDEFLTVAYNKQAFIPTGPGYRICGQCNDQERQQAGQIIGVPQ